jgi:hypothetical protein
MLPEASCRDTTINMPKALITGITGQDGSYLAEFLSARGYEIHGLKRRSSSFNTNRVDHLYEDFHNTGARFFLHYADLTDASSLAWCLSDIRPDEIYNLGAQSHVKVSFEIPEYTSDVVALGTMRLLEAIRRTGIKCRYYQASSSEMFGSTPPPQSETTVFHPRSPYACAKVFAHQATVNYRESYGLHASCGILLVLGQRSGDASITLEDQISCHQKCCGYRKDAPGSLAHYNVRCVAENKIKRQRINEGCHKRSRAIPHKDKINTHRVADWIEMRRTVPVQINRLDRHLPNTGRTRLAVVMQFQQAFEFKIVPIDRD